MDTLITGVATLPSEFSIDMSESMNYNSYEYRCIYMKINISIEEQQAKLLTCIGEPTRLQIIKLLAGGEKFVNEIVKELGKEQSLVSHHLKSLKACGIIVSSQRAQKIYYRLCDPRIAELVLTSEALLRDLPLCQHELESGND
jgi:DNA-binding transcriptional ArsR family regulator